MTNHPNSTLYIGVTNDLNRRLWEHRHGFGNMFARRYYLKHLVYTERHEDIRIAIQREKSLKRWSRAWQVDLIAAQNPEWRDLGDQLQ